MKFLLTLLLTIPFQANSQTNDWIFGVTINDPWTQTADIAKALESHCVKPTARIVFDEFVAASEYQDVVNQLSPSCDIMGEILDSYYVKEYSVDAYLNRTNEYLDAFEDVVSIWEIGNEVNGDWLGDSVVQKIEGAFDLVKARGQKTELTLYYNRDCFYDHPENELFAWVDQNIPESMKMGLDYVLISYYEDDCEDVKLSETEWQNVFDSLHVRFPNSQIGMGECGTKNVENKAEFMNRYYQMNITTPNYIGGYFWWYYKEDCVPKTSELWSTINDISCALQTSTIDNSNDSYPIRFYPNPAHTTLQISDPTIKKIQFRNHLGQIVLDINHPSSINIAHLPAGVYLVFVNDRVLGEEIVIFR